MKVSKATRAAAIECLLTCAAARQWGRPSPPPIISAVSAPWVVTELAEAAYGEIAGLHLDDYTNGSGVVPRMAERYHAAASLLDAGWEP